MKRSLLLCSFVCLMILGFSCHDRGTTAQQDVTKDRDMFGFKYKRSLIKNSEGLSPGYILFAETNSPFIDLINRKGEVVHQWKSNYGVFNAYLQEDGSIFLGANDPDYPVFGFGGPYGRIQKIAWDGKMLWDYELANEHEIVHHDFTVMPNGHILAIVYEATSREDALALGRKKELMPESGAWLEKILEIVPQGPRGGEVVWQWRLADHLIQGMDESKANFGNPAEHPELIDFNVGQPAPPVMNQDTLDALKAKGMAERNQTINNRGADLYHFNAIDYNADLDQIVFSSPQLSEIFIIDHSVSTEEAAGHQGGFGGKGGDLLYRWGNPHNYGQGDSTSRQLFGQHDVRWIAKGLPGGGDLTVFNNHPPGDIDWSTMGNTGNNYSMVFEITPPLNGEGSYTLAAGKAYGPEKPTWFYRAPDTLSFYSSFISGAQRMPDGHTFINEGARGRFFEVTPEGETVWEYLNPYRGNIHQPNGDPVNPMFMPYSTFRANFIPESHPAFAGKELTPLNPQPEVFVLPPPGAMAENH